MNKKTRWYRFLEMLPGLIAWFFILFPLWGAFVIPKLVAYFALAFATYWLWQSFKTATLAIIGYFKIKAAKNTNWLEKFNQDFRARWLPYRDIHHVIIISSYKEPNDVIEMAVGSLAAQVDIDLKKLHVILAQEARAGKENNQKTIDYFSAKYKGTFGHLIFTEHPSNLPGETAGKHTNEAWAAKYFKKKYIDSGRYQLKNLTLTSCDVDTLFHPKYFSCLTYNFARNHQRYYRFWQAPIIWHRNINQVPALIRIVGIIGNVGHIAGVQELDGLFFNYSCYSSSYYLIDSAGYWDPDVISEDWHIFLQTFFANQGRVAVEPIFLPAVVDAPSGETTWIALRNRYKQCVRQAWGCTDIPYALEQARLHREIPFITRYLRVFKIMESYFIWASNWFLLTLGSSLPVLLNPHFFATTLGFNLPRIVRLILTICLIPLICLIIVDWQLRPADLKGGWRTVLKNLIQWPFLPVATFFLSVLPGLESQTRLMLGGRLEYWTTPKKA